MKHPFLLVGAMVLLVLAVNGASMKAPSSRDPSDHPSDDPSGDPSGPKQRKYRSAEEDVSPCDPSSENCDSMRAAPPQETLPFPPPPSDMMPPGFTPKTRRAAQNPQTSSERGQSGNMEEIAGEMGVNMATGMKTAMNSGLDAMAQMSRRFGSMG